MFYQDLILIKEKIMFIKKKNGLAAPHDFKFDLGDKLKDKITGFSGVVIYRSQWLSNCNTYGLKPTILKDSKPMDTEQFDEPLLTLMEKKVHEENRDTGGPTEKIIPTNRRGQ
jgi:hypothetical protein